MLTFKKFILESIILLENRIEFLKNKFKDISTDHDPHGEHKDAHSIIDHFSNHDPHPTKANTQWILNQYRKGNVRQEDGPRISTSLTNFERHKSRLANKDINSYKHIADLDTAVEPHLGTVSKKQEKAQIKHEGADLIYKSPSMTVHKLKTKEAACHYGAGTKWCTAAKNNNFFDHYNKQGPIYVINHSDGSKHQFHFESEQFADEQDRMHSLPDLVKKHPDLKNVKEFKDKHHAFLSTKEQHQKIEDYLKSPEPLKAQLAFNYPEATPEHISKGLSHPDYRVNIAAISHNNATPEHIDKALDIKDDYLKRNAAKHPNATPENIMKALNLKDEEVTGFVARRKDLTSDHITHIMQHGTPHQKERMFSKTNFGTHHLDMAIKDANPDIRANVMYDIRATPEHFRIATTDKHPYVVKATLQSRHASNDYIMSHKDHKDTGIRHSVMDHLATRSNITDEMKTHVAQHGLYGHIEDLINTHTLESHHIDHILKNPRADLNGNVVRNMIHFNKERLTDQNIVTGLNHNDHSVSKQFYTHVDVTPEHIAQIKDTATRNLANITLNSREERKRRERETTEKLHGELFPNERN